jgi:lipopolysaccharide export system protein LptA
MIKYLISVYLILNTSLLANELRIKAESFHADEKKGVSVFKGNVNIIRAKDELNAHQVTVYTNKKNEPIKYVAKGNAVFNIVTQDSSVYKGKAQKVIYQPNTKEYHFYGNVHLEQVDEKKEIKGNEVVLKTIEGKAYAKGAESKPVIMIFNMPKDEEK